MPWIHSPISFLNYWLKTSIRIQTRGQPDYVIMLKTWKCIQEPKSDTNMPFHRLYLRHKYVAQWHTPKAHIQNTIKPTKFKRTEQQSSNLLVYYKGCLESTFTAKKRHLSVRILSDLSIENAGALRSQQTEYSYKKITTDYISFSDTYSVCFVTMC
jgi:hypothetical protein